MQNETIKVQNKNEWKNCASSSTRWSLKSPIRSSRKARVRWPSSSGGWPEPRSGRPGFRLPATDLKILNVTAIVNHFIIIGLVASSNSTRWSHGATIWRSNLTGTQSNLLCHSVVSFLHQIFSYCQLENLPQLSGDAHHPNFKYLEHRSTNKW